jgi:hypothetical protein
MDKTSTKHETPPIANVLLGEVFYYKSLTSFEHFWYNDLYFVIQDISDEWFKMKPYAKIFSQNTQESNDLLDYVRGKQLVKNVSFDEMKTKLNRAFEIVSQNFA